MKNRSIRNAAVALIALAASGTASAAASLNASAPAAQSYATGAAARFLVKAGKPRLRFVFAANQVYGERCVTKYGWCQILPQPVGAPCKCGDVDGTTLQ